MVRAVGVLYSVRGVRQAQVDIGVAVCVQWFYFYMLIVHRSPSAFSESNENES